MNKVQVQLSCGHHAREDVRKLDLTVPVRCHFCGTYESITTLYAREWRAVCLSCQFGRWTGQSYLVAEAHVSRHRKRYPRHDVFSTYDRVTGDGRGNVNRDTCPEHLRGMPEETSLFLSEPENGSTA